MTRRITGKQRAARKRNIKIAQAASKRGIKRSYAKFPRERAVTKKQASKNPIKRSAAKMAGRPQELKLNKVKFMGKSVMKVKPLDAGTAKHGRKMNIATKHEKLDISYPKIIKKGRIRRR